MDAQLAGGGQGTIRLGCVARMTGPGRRRLTPAAAVSDVWHCHARAARLLRVTTGRGIVTGPAGPGGHSHRYAALLEECGFGMPCGVREPTPTPYQTAASTQPHAPVVRAGQSRRQFGPSRSQIRLRLTPGQKGTRQLVAKYGERLVRVRYRYDPGRKKRYKTVEIIVGERDWDPPGLALPTTRSSASASPSKRWTSGRG